MFCDIFLVPFPCRSCDLSFFPSPDECRFPLQHPRGHQTLLRWPGLQEHLGFCTRKGSVLGGWRHWGVTLCLIETTALLFPIFSELSPSLGCLSWSILNIPMFLALPCSFCSVSRCAALQAGICSEFFCKSRFLLQTMAWTAPGYLYFPVLMGNRCLKPGNLLITTPTRTGGIK